MKIIAGKFKGRNLTYRERRGLRVTSQLVKEAMFGMIGNHVEGAMVLDLYCGYGTLGLEAISRGAKQVTFVDTDGQALKQLKFFLDKLEVADQGELVKRDAIKVVKHLPPQSYDVIVMDPPYHINFEEKTLEAIDKCETLKPGGLCVVEHYNEYMMPEKVGKLVKQKVRNYGDTSLSIYLNTAEELTGAVPCATVETEESPEIEKPAKPEKTDKPEKRRQKRYVTEELDELDELIKNI